MVAIYARQSLEKKDSLSIEQQISMCKAVAGDDDIEIYSDSGFSGGNTRRPDFQRMISDCLDGKINKIIVYRLDRFSRSLLDFMQIWNELQEQNISLVSATEQFDTSSAIGKAMLQIIVVFAQMERENIISRGTDNYYHRLREGAWPGGIAPFGFTIDRQNINGKMQAVLIPNLDKIKYVKWMFAQYATGTVSLGVLAKKMHDELPDERVWNNVAIHRILLNPVYAAADADLYAYYYNAGTEIISPIQDFDGTHSALCIGYRHAERRKRRPISEQKLYLTRCQPFVSSAEFVAVQKNLSKNKQIKNSVHSKLSWLSGMISCDSCGRAIRLVDSHGLKTTRAYLNCTGHNRTYGCAIVHSERIEQVEDYVLKEINNHVAAISDGGEGTLTAEERKRLNELKQNLITIEKQQKNLIDAIALGGKSSTRLLLEQIEKLDEQKSSITEEIEKLSRSKIKLPSTVSVDAVNLDFEEKRFLARMLIERIMLLPNSIRIIWKT